MAHKAGKKGKGQSLGAIEKKIAWIDVQHRKKMDEIKTIKKSSELKKRLQQKENALKKATIAVQKAKASLSGTRKK